MFNTVLSHAAEALILGVANAGALCMGWRSLSGTTLRAAWYWTLAATATVSSAEIFVKLPAASVGNGDWMIALRYSAAMTTFLPIMAVLGAKRPQDRGWQFIVASLWMILCLPSGQAWFLGGGRPLMVHSAWSWFLAAMILLQCGNYLPTRYGPSSLLFAAAQTVLLWDWLPGIAGAAASVARAAAVRPLIALLLAAVAGWLTVSGIPRRRSIDEPLDRVWRDFRDQFGAAWALRVMERINTTARLSDWPLKLTWSGFHNQSSVNSQSSWQLEISPEIRAGVEETLKTLLRRFVSPDWINQRLDH